MRWTLTAVIIVILLLMFMAWFFDHFLSGTVFRMPAY